MEQDLDDTIIRPVPLGDQDESVLLDDTVLATQTPIAHDQAPQPEAIPALVEAPPAAPTARLQTWYCFQVNSHEPIGLDRPAHIGRRPGLPRVPPPVRPRLVRVPSPLSEVSATHLELRQQGPSVIATDLRSTNGTIVIVPGLQPRSLRPGESLVITPGTVVNIGDGNRIELLPLQRSLRLPSTSPATGHPRP